jgi:hypothetical protein
MNQLEPCPHCHRHVQVSETACPFCAEALDFSAVAPRAVPRTRLSRAATFAFGAVGAVAMSQVACGDDGSPAHDAAVNQDAHHDTVTTHDTAGDTRLPDAMPDAASDAFPEGGIPIYAAAPNDAGTPGEPDTRHT